ncbi:MAG: hypothetical protein JW812_01990 [Alphaproteobacteria bacterium]|nr:hypothetical protein [Alphaproteobacteria bacterium]MBN2779694.1 hypothetical protein [Alphaproteobacteria bacterium]
MKLKNLFIFSGLVVLVFVGMTPVYGRVSSRAQGTRYAGSGSYSSDVVTRNQNYVATTGNTTGGGIGDPLGGQGCDDEGLCTKCKRLVAQSLQSYCRENECSEASNAFIIAKALPLSSTLVNIDQALYDSPSTAVSSPVLAQGQGYDQSLVQACQPSLVKHVEEFLPAYYDIVTQECHTQYKTAIDHYMANNKGGFKMGPAGQKGAIRNFELLEYFKLHSTPDYATSLYQDTTSEDYFFSAYCMAQMADSVKRSLIDLYLPDMFTYQRNMCRRSYEMAMQKYCNAGGGMGCRGEIDYMTLIMNQSFLNQIRSDNTQINCATELSQDVREALVEEVTRKQNMCAREMGLYNAEKDMCQFSISLIDAKNKEIERKQYFEGETVKCNETDFIDPYSKEGRKRVGKGWLMSQTGANILYGTGGAVLGSMVGGGIGENVAEKAKLNQVLTNNGVSNEDLALVRKKVVGLSGDYLNAEKKLVGSGKIEKDIAQSIIEDLYDVEKEVDDDGVANPDKTTWKVGRMLIGTKNAKTVGKVVGAVAGVAGGVAGSKFVYKKLYQETKCYKTWRLAAETLDDAVSLEVLSDTDRPWAEWGSSKALPTLVQGMQVEIDSLSVYDREYPGEPEWENK